MNRNNQSARLRKIRRMVERGVTLVEVLIVVAIMALIAGSVGFLVLPKYREAQIKTCRSDERTIRNVATQFLALKNGDCPTIQTLIAEKELDSSANTKDPWGGEYVVTCTGDDVTVASAGPDKKMGTQDDIIVGGVQTGADGQAPGAR